MMKIFQNQRKGFLFLMIIVIFLAIPAFTVPGFSSNNPYKQEQEVDFASVLKGLEFREIGPSIMGGRVDDISVVESNPKIVYVGLASGGVWKSLNAGTTWKPIFENEPVSSIGSVAVAQSNPSIVWVGTGEPNNRQSSSWGDGVYKSTDAGLSWKHMGLSDTHHIGRILIHPGDPDIVFVAALGRLWGANRERGVFKSVDGGKTWRHVLFINEDTGAVDLAMDPMNPDILLAAVYQRRRTAYGFNGGGPHSAIYKTKDEGETWSKLVKGLPYENEKDGQTGRIGLNIYRSDPSIIYAIVEHANGGVFRSEDWGETWAKMSDLNPRPMYFSKIRVDPNNDLRIWVMGKLLYSSEDGGKTFTTPPVRIIHGDYHAMWINPRDSNHMIIGTDGGLSWSWDHGETWDVLTNISIGQFYEVCFDLQKPYFVYGGLQDNGTWKGPSRTLITKGATNITNDDWLRIGGADGFYVQVDPANPNMVYAETQNGQIFRRNLGTLQSRSIRPHEGENDPTFRFQWNSPFIMSSHDSKTLYLGSQFLFKSTDRGDSWTKISPDLTTGADRDAMPIMGKLPDEKTLSLNDGVRSWPCITTIGESSVNPAVLWVGTDDGNLQVTRNGGRTWRNAAYLVPGLPERTYVSRVVASKYAEGRAYAVFDGHRMNDFSVYVYTTVDFGQTWRTISNGIPLNNGTVHVIREHPRNPDLLFLGTEQGAYISFDRGGQWTSLKLNMPTVPVHDIAVHPRENDLIVGTHGRSLWILDDITPLEELNRDCLAESLYLFDLRPATTWRIYFHEAARGNKVFSGQNPPNGAIINYYLNPERTIPGQIRIKVDDKAGKTICEFNGPSKPGINRTTWDLRYDSLVESKKGRLRGTSRSLRRGPTVEPGAYTITVFSGDKSSRKTVLVEEDPRVTISDADRAARYRAVLQTFELSKSLLLGFQKIYGFKEFVQEAKVYRKKTKAHEIADTEFEAISRKIKSLDRRLRTISSRLERLVKDLSGWIAAPTSAQNEELLELKALLKKTLESISELSQKYLYKAKDDRGPIGCHNSSHDPPEEVCAQLSLLWGRYEDYRLLPVT